MQRHSAVRVTFAVVSKANGVLQVLQTKGRLIRIAGANQLVGTCISCSHCSATFHSPHEEIEAVRHEKSQRVLHHEIHVGEEVPQLAETVYLVRRLFASNVAPKCG